MIRPAKSLAIASIIPLFISAFGCGSSHTAQSLSPAQAQAVSQELSSALGSALLSAFSSGMPVSANEHPTIAAAVNEFTAAQASGCTITNTGQDCSIPMNYSGSCPGGGTISVTGNFDFTLDGSGNGSDNSSVTILPTNCSVSNLVINGDPNVTVTTQFNIQADSLAYPINLTETGGISYGPNPSGSCTLNSTMTVTSPTTCSINANICGQKFSGSC
ncbi:MAG TPA: hypothetical protein VGS78_03395 [Candidatus Sulfotelmatobacter sp.]|nr:hypothetical protein [Candidatus Sulfotelmatobacter sp.]